MSIPALFRGHLRPRSAPVLGDMLRPTDNSFGVIRLAMALAVLVSHSYYLASGVALTSEPVHAWTGYTLGQHGVQVFFILSGVLVAQSLHKGGLIAFTQARLLRIFPALVVCVLLIALVLGPLVSGLTLSAYLKHPELPRYIVDTLSLRTGMAPLPGVFADNPAKGVVNSSLWTLKYEVMCYAMLAIGGTIAIKLNRAQDLGFALVGAMIGLTVWNRPDLGATNTLLDTIQYFALFFGTGVFAYGLRDRLPVHGLGALAAVALLALTNRTHLAEWGHAIGLGYLMLYAATFRFGPLRAFTNRQDYSYGVYIISVPVGQALLLLAPGMSALPLALATASVTVPLAALSWMLVERPAIRLRARFPLAGRRFGLPAKAT